MAEEAAGKTERQAIGKDLLRANRLWVVRTDLATKRTARVLLCPHRDRLVALHAFIKKTRATAVDDLALARKRQKDLER